MGERSEKRVSPPWWRLWIHCGWKKRSHWTGEHSRQLLESVQKKLAGLAGGSLVGTALYHMNRSVQSLVKDCVEYDYVAHDIQGCSVFTWCKVFYQENHQCLYNAIYLCLYTIHNDYVMDRSSQMVWYGSTGLFHDSRQEIKLGTFRE